MHAARHLIAIALLLAAGPAAAQRNSHTGDFHTLETGPGRPVVAWANPAALGPLRVLAIAPYSTMGDVAQLRDHLEMDLETVALWERENIGFDPRFPQPAFPEASRDNVIKRLERGLRRKKLDLIIIAQCDPAILPASLQEKIIARVEDGVGLLLANHGMAHDSIFGTWLKALPAPPVSPDLLHGVGSLGIGREIESSMIRFHASEEARIVHLTFFHEPTKNHGLIPLPDSPYNVQPEYADNAFSLLAKAAQWAAHRASPVHITNVVDVSPRGPDDDEIPPGYPPEFIEAVRKNAFTQPIRPYVLHLEEPAPSALDVRYRLRHVGSMTSDVIYTSDLPLKKGASYYPLDVIATPGAYLLDVWIRNKKGIVAWYTEEIEIPGWPTLSNLRVTHEDKPAVWIRPNDYLVVEADVGQGALLTRRQQGTVFARVVDSFGRQIARDSVVINNDGGPISLRLEVADVLAPMIMVEVFAAPDLLENEARLVREAAREVFYLPVRLPEAPRQPTVIITTKMRLDHGAYRQLEVLRDQFGASVLHAPLSLDTLLAAGRLGLQRLSQILPTQPDILGTDVTRIPCLSSPTYNDELLRSVESGILQSYAGGPPFYSLGAGNTLTHSDAEFCHGPDCLEHFRTRLKATYGTLDSLNIAWDTDIPAWGMVAPKSLEACREQNFFLPWIDFRSSMNSVFAQSLQRSAEKVRQLDPQGRVGFQPPSQTTTPWSGIQWAQICASMDYVVVPNDANAIRRLQSFQEPQAWSGVVVDSSYFQGSPEQARWFAWHCALEQLPAIWLNEPTASSATRLLDPTGRARSSFAAFGEAHHEIRRGLGTLLLRAKPYRNAIAFLDTPENDMLTAVLSEEDRIQQKSEAWFADTLNTLGFAPVVRSLLPALGQTLDDINTVILADTHVLTEAQRNALTAFHKKGGLIVASRLPKPIDVPLVETGPSALPFLHPLGKISDTTELWCNRPAWTRQFDGTWTATQQLEALVLHAENEPMPKFKSATGQRNHLRRYYYAYGAATIVAFLPDRESTHPLKRISLPIPKGHHAYNLRSAEPLSNFGRYQWSPTPGEATIISILPYRVKKIILAVSATASAGKRLPVTILLDTGKAKPGLHPIALRVEGPDGKELLHYSQVVVAQEGHAQTFLSLAQNEVPGSYTFIATDLLSGTSQHVSVTIR